MQSFPFLSLSGFLLILPGSFGRSAILFLPLSLICPHIYPTFHPCGPDFVLVRAVTSHTTHIQKNAKNTPPSNIIITDDGVPYILDWSHATQGNASADVARTYLLFWLNGDIEGANIYLDTFCKKSDTAKQYVQKWMPIVAASQSVKGNANEREFLMSWVDVVDYQ